MKKITAKFAGHCQICDEPINVGDTVMWAKGHGTFHFDCYEAERTDDICAGYDREDIELEDFLSSDTAQSEAIEMLRQEIDDSGYDPREAEYEAEQSRWD